MCLELNLGSNKKSVNPVISVTTLFGQVGQSPVFNFFLFAIIADITNTWKAVDTLVLWCQY